MKYFKTSQFVPGKGDAWTFYECDDHMAVCRTVTHLPLAGETTRVPDPIVKKIFRPELLLDSSEAEFIEHWNKG